MSFYSRYNGYRGFGYTDATQALQDAQKALSNQGIAATQVSMAADADVAAAKAQHDAAVARLAEANKLDVILNNVDGAWFKKYNEGGSIYLTLSPLEMQVFKYIDGFPDVNEAYKATGQFYPGGINYNAENPLLERARELSANAVQNLPAEVQDASANLTSAKSTAAKAKAELDRLSGLAEAAGRKFQDAVKADQKVEAKVAETTAKVVTQNQIDARVLKTVNDTKIATELAKASKKGVSPLVIAAVAVPVLGAIAWAMTRKKTAAVAGYRRRRSRK